MAPSRADDSLLQSVLLEDVPGVREFGQPQAGRVGWVAVMSDVGNDVQDALGIAWHFLTHSRSRSQCCDVYTKRQKWCARVYYVDGMETRQNSILGSEIPKVGSPYKISYV